MAERERREERRGEERRRRAVFTVLDEYVCQSRAATLKSSPKPLRQRPLSATTTTRF